jgi:hypothetical protein
MMHGTMNIKYKVSKYLSKYVSKIKLMTQGSKMHTNSQRMYSKLLTVTTQSFVEMWAQFWIRNAHSSNKTRWSYPAPRFDYFMNKCWLVTAGNQIAGRARLCVRSTVDCSGPWLAVCASHVTGSREGVPPFGSRQWHCLAWPFSWFSSVVTAKFWMALLNTVKPLPSTSLPIHYSFINVRKTP